MKHKCYITPSTLFVPGTAERILAELGAGPIGKDARGRIVAHLTQGQIDLWGIKGPAHRLEIAPEVEEPAPVPPEASAAGVPVEAPFTPSIIVESATGDRQVISIDQHPVPPALEPNHEALQGDTSSLEPAPAGKPEKTR